MVTPAGGSSKVSMSCRRRATSSWDGRKTPTFSAARRERRRSHHANREIRLQGLGVAWRGKATCPRFASPGRGGGGRHPPELLSASGAEVAGPPLRRILALQRRRPGQGSGGAGAN